MKTKLILPSKALLFILPLTLCVLVFLSFNNNPNIDFAVSFSITAPLKKTVVIDAGHGGFDAGTTSIYGKQEKDINLEIALKTESVLKLMGYNVIMTRTRDAALDTTKKADMYKRLDIVEKSENSVFVSIHQNHFSQSRYSGAQMFYGEKNDMSERLAAILQQNFKENLNPQNDRQIKKAYDDLFLFKKSTKPSVLIECGFLSNPNEARLLVNEDYQSKIAFTISQSVMEYFAYENK